MSLSPKPTLIELVNREVFKDNSGTVIENTFYVEPYESAEHVLYNLLGGTHLQARIYPARDSKILHCFCYQANILPLNKEQFSYCKTLNIQNNTVKEALETDFEYIENVSQKIVSDENKNYTAGCFIVAKYKNVISGNGFEIDLQQDIPSDLFDYIDIKREQRELIHPIPFGLRLKTIQRGYYMPKTGVAPVIKENYTHLTVRRLYVPIITNDNLDFLNGMINCVNQSSFDFMYPGNRVQTCTLKFVGYEEERCVALHVTEEGLKGTETYANYTLKFDIRTLKQVGTVHGADGTLIDGEADVNWQMQLAWPGRALVLGAELMGVGKHMQLGWYWTGYTSSFLPGIIQGGVETLRHPYVTRTPADFQKLFTIKG